MEDDTRVAVELIQAGGEITGGAAGAGIGLLVAGPPGAVGGALVGSLIRVGADFAHRHLSARQRRRAGTVLGAAADRVQDRLTAGDQIRDDGFFTERSDRESPADEVMEAVLIAVRDEPEQRKVPYMGYLIANIAFDPTVDERTGHDLVVEAGALSYTQLVLLAAVARADEFPLPRELGRSARRSLEAVTVLSQFADLGYASRELIGVEAPEQGLPTNVSVPADQILKYRGVVLSSLMELSRMPDEDIDAVVRVLWEAFGSEQPGR